MTIFFASPCNLSAISDTKGKTNKTFKKCNIDVETLIKLSRILQHNVFQDIANQMDEKYCLKSLDSMSENLLQNVEKLDTEKVGGEEDSE